MDRTKTPEDVIRWLRSEKDDLFTKYANAIEQLQKELEIERKKVRVLRKSKGFKVHDDRPVSTSKHLGEVGRRTVFEGLVLKRKRWFDNAYGGSEMVTFQDPQGNVLLYWGNTFSLDEEGARMSLKATVKKHDVFAGVEQTVISRPNILEA